MKHPIILLALLCAGCASSGSKPVYPGTATGRGTGVVQPGQKVIVSNPAYQQPGQVVFGAPSNIPQPIRAPQTQAPQGFDTSGSMAGQYDEMGRFSMAQADPDRAEFNFERALEVNPFDPVALNNLAVVKAERGQFHEAVSLLERAAKLAPDNAEVVANLARLRGYVQSYATAGVEPGIAARPPNGALPPPPPALWRSYAEAATPVANDRVAPQQDYYNSDACSRKPGKKGTVQIICEPR